MRERSERQARRQLHLPRRLGLLEQAVGRAAAGVAQRVGGKGAGAEDVVHLAEVRRLNRLNTSSIGVSVTRAESRIGRASRMSAVTCAGSRSELRPTGRRRVWRHGARAIGSRQAVAVEVRAGKRRERDPGGGREDAGEREAPGRHPRAAHHQPMRLVRVGGAFLAVRIESKRQAGRIWRGCDPCRCLPPARRSARRCPRRVDHVYDTRSVAVSCRTAASPTAAGRDTTSRRSR